MDDLVSVIIPAYNQSKYIRETIDSVLKQTYNNVEIIVVNDGSTDDTLKILQEYGNKIKIINQKNKGLAGARNSGIREAKGDYLAFLDSDDLWYNNMLSVMVSHLKNNQQSDIAACSCDLIDEKSQRIRRFNRMSFFRNKIKNSFLRTLTLINMFPVHTLLIRKKCFDCCGVFDESLRATEDWDLWLRMAVHGHKFLLIDDVIAKYRIHGESMTHDPKRMEESWLKVLNKLLANENAKPIISDLKNDIYISSWLRQAVYNYAVNDSENMQRCISEAEQFINHTQISKETIWRHLSLLAKLPDTELLAKRIGKNYSYEFAEYYLASAIRSLRTRDYNKFFTDMFKSFFTNPISFFANLFEGVYINIIDRLRG